MVEKTWEVIKVRLCSHAGCDVALEVEKLIPPERLGLQPSRLENHRCSNALACMQNGISACVWSGGDPLLDPFRS